MLISSTSTTSSDEPPVRCCDGCGAVTTEPVAAAHGWSLLETSSRWRCPTCAQALANVNTPKPS